MRKFFLSIWTSCIVFVFIYGQSGSIDRHTFFADSSIQEVTITTNMSKLLKNNKLGVMIPGKISMTFPDGTTVNEPVEMIVRGHMRHDYCYVPPLKLVFNAQPTSALASFKSLKLVNECKISNMYDQYILKEFLCYKIYNMITEMSFRARLLQLHIKDSSGNKKEMTFHAFLLEDIKDVAKRNGCHESKKLEVATEATNRRQTTIVSVFEYLIANTDWAVSVNHNTKLISSIKDSVAKPFVVPYDFDYAGLVNTEYAIPDEKLDIENVRERLYRGYPRTIVEINEVLDIFNQKKEKIYAYINNFGLLAPATKRDLLQYLDDFYKTIKDPGAVKDIFIKNARTE